MKFSWRRGQVVKAEVCKTFISGSIPLVASRVCSSDVTVFHRASLPFLALASTALFPPSYGV